ncbi:LytR C-terminal domain-containing protein [Anaerosporobacter faecicola]|uniref:LytR C-terminal domain-containing protein n=1 Tax=Anaerosporobacter faecicola TaxID=2718714 RepID=UPI00143BA7EF|nr:LytR C-terminal domain-containing protein [Anaerosporobacter faecicola]
MKRNKHVQAFVRGFVRTGCMMILMFIVGFASYKITLGIYKLTHKDASPSATTTTMASDGVADNICRNLIYIADEEDNIEGAVVEILNTYTYNLDYVTIPVNANFTLSTELYQKLYAKDAQIPQIISLEKLNAFFDNSTRFGYGKLIINELLGNELSCYTIIDKETAESIFNTEEKTMVLGDGESLEGTVYTIKDSLITTIGEEESLSMKEYLARFYEVAKSNLSLESKQKYASTYKNVNPDYIYYYILPGIHEGDTYSVDEEKTQQLIQQLIANEAYTITQEEASTVEPISSIGHAISLLNGSKITGLASKYSSIIQNAGFTVGEIGNYTDTVLEETKIIVNQEGLGLDLVSLFQAATVEVGEVPVGYDIQIILGVSENR